MLFVRLRRANDTTVRFGRVLPEASHIVELLDGDPLQALVQATGETLPYTPDVWQSAVDASSNQDAPPAAVELLCPVTPSKIIGVGSNYRNHAREMGKPIPDEPLLFLKPPSALLAPGRAIARPPGYERVDYEGELAVVIGKTLYRQPPEHVEKNIFGYTILNDVTVRDLQKKDGQFTRAKGFDSFCPIGPAVVAATAFDARKIRIVTRKNGAVVQDSLGDELIFSVVQLLSFISQVMTLQVGDVVTTGTPAGVGNLVPGDRIEIEIPEIGVLRNSVIAGPAPPSLGPSKHGAHLGS